MDRFNDDYLRYGFYAKGIFPVVTDRELSNPKFIREMRNYAASLDVPYMQIRDFITTWYARAPVLFHDHLDREVMINTAWLETPSFDYWARDFCKPVPMMVRPRIRIEARNRAGAFCSLLRAHKGLSEQ